MKSALNYQALYSLARNEAQAYQSASPFPHAIMEDLISEEYLNRVLAVFPSPEQTQQWRRLKIDHQGRSMQQGKLGLAKEHSLHPLIRNLIWELNSCAFIEFLQRLTGIKNLIADPEIRGGGLHQILPGGVLGIHADFTHHASYDVDRRINLLIYLNKDWQDEYKGHLQLWSKDLAHCEKIIRPSFGRCVIFNTDDDSFHGHPEPLACPAGKTRKSIALYYYTNGRTDRDVAHTSETDWQHPPDADKPGYV